MFLSITPGKDVVKTQLSFQSKQYQHYQIQPQRETIKQPTFQQRILTLSQESLPIRNPFSQTWFQVWTKIPALNSHCTTTFSQGSLTSVTAAGASGEKEQRGTTWQAPCLKVPTFALEAWICLLFFYTDSSHTTAPIQGCVGRLTQPLGPGTRADTWELLFLAKKTDLETLPFHGHITPLTQSCYPAHEQPALPF